MQVPKYMDHFKCIGGACEDNCCIGWDVDIDKVTFTKYQKVTHPLMQRELKQYIKVNPDVYSDAINYAFAVLTPEKHCRFLNTDRLCMIQKHLGESYLSNVCSSFPRITNKIDGKLERSATPSCPEVMRLLADNPDAMTLASAKDPDSTPIISFDIKQNDKRFRGTLISELLIVRDTCLHVFKSDDMPLESQLFDLANFIVNIVKMEKNNNLPSLKQYISNQTSTSQHISSGRSEAFLTFSEMLIDHLKQLGADDSTRYVELTNIASQGDVTTGYKHFEAFNQNNSHVIRNLIKNHIFKSLFPFSEGENAEEALWLLLSRYAMIKRQLIGLAGYHNQLNHEMVVSYLQVFSKVIEHHKHFETRTIETLRTQKLNSKKLMSIIL
jgi:lysine-N-methylase